MQTGAGLIPMSLDIEVCDDAGRVAVRLRGLSSRQLPTEENIQTLLLTPDWKEETVPGQRRAQPLQPDDPAPLLIQPLVLLCGLPNISASRIQAQMTSGGRCRSLYSSHLRREYRFQDMVTQLIQELRGLQQSRLAGAPTTSPLAGKEVEAVGVEDTIPTATSLVQVVVAHEEEQPSLLEALMSVLRTAQLEDLTLQGQLIEIDEKPEESELLVWLRENQLRPYEPHIHYRNGQRWVREWRELNTIQKTKRPQHDVGSYVGGGGLVSTPFTTNYVPWKEGGCYLITGGAGGLA